MDALAGSPQRPAIIVITGAGASEAARVRTGDLVRAVVTKPFELHSIAALLNDVLAGGGVAGSGRAP